MFYFTIIKDQKIKNKCFLFSLIITHEHVNTRKLHISTSPALISVLDENKIKGNRQLFVMFALREVNVQLQVCREGNREFSKPVFFWQILAHISALTSSVSALYAWSFSLKLSETLFNSLQTHSQGEKRHLLTGVSVSADEIICKHKHTSSVPSERQLDQLLCKNKSC